MRNRKKILIIDDEKKIGDSCSEALKREGWQTVSRLNGETGLAAYSDFQPDVVLLDLRMPDLDGMTVLKRIRARDENAVVVVITGYATIQSAVDSIKRGAFDFLPKPFTPGELRMIARRALERRRLLEEAEILRLDKRRMREDFIAMVSHQLRTPLVAVKQYHDVLLDGITGPLSPDQKDVIFRSRKRVDEMLTLIRDWLALSRMDGNTARAESAPFDLIPLLRDVVEVVCSSAGESSLSISFPSEAAFPVHGVRDLMREALINVLVNAVRYNREDGKVDIVLERGDGEARIRVIDTGVGIDPDERPRIFEEFFRGSRVKGIPGTGLGLAIVKRILDLHDGAVDVESGPGSGTAVTLRWPDRGDGKERRPK